MHLSLLGNKAQKIFEMCILKPPRKLTISSNSGLFQLAIMELSRVQWSQLQIT